MTPKWPASMLLARAIGERLGRPVTPDEIGMALAETPHANVGSDCLRDHTEAVRVATSFWGSVDSSGQAATEGTFAESGPQMVPKNDLGRKPGGEYTKHEEAR